MKLFEFTKAMIFAIPLGIFSTLAALLLVINAIKVRRLEFNKTFFFYFICATLSSVLFYAYYYFPSFFHKFDFVYCCALVFTIVLFHKFHCFCIGYDKRFSSWHYIVPTIVLCVLLTVKLFLSGSLTIRNYDLSFFVILIFSAFYVILGLYEMHRFYLRQSITYGSTEGINHSRVVLLVLEKLMFPTVFGLLPFIGGQHPGTVISILLMVSILGALYNNIPLVYSIIRYVTLNDVSRSLFDVVQLRRKPLNGTNFAESDDSKDLQNVTTPTEPMPEALKEPLPKPPPVKRVYRKYNQSNRSTGLLIEVDKVEFENYFRKNKPYMNPHLTITDLIKPLNCNRSYLSKFINRTYGMNFNNYINSCRLREMKRLLATPGNRNKTPASLYAQAGFANYRNYLSAKKIAEQNHES